VARETSLGGLARTFDPARDARAGSGEAAFEATALAPPTAPPAPDAAPDDADVDLAGYLPKKSAPGVHRSLLVAAAAIAIGAVAAGVGAKYLVSSTAREVETRMKEDEHKREEARLEEDVRARLRAARTKFDEILGRMATIPAGAFQAGSDDYGNDEKPRHRVEIKAFELDPTEVSVVAYELCVKAGGCALPEDLPHCNYGKPDKQKHPINCVDLPQATAFCAWAGKRLPTEEEWEYAARTTESRQYPWGDAPPQADACWKRFDKAQGRRDGTCERGQYASGDSGFGVKDLAGNVREWTASTYCPYTRPDCVGQARVVRGGGWNDDDPVALRSSARERVAPAVRRDDLGFRCARDP
jgi:formylglycine-generating enzyme required for sulfatase activity